jgi:hypothetical protein
MSSNCLAMIPRILKGVFLQLSSGHVSAQSADELKRIIGAWRLVSIETGTLRHNRGSRPIGFLYYDQNGYMAVQIMPSRSRKKFSAGGPTPDEARDALAGYTAYFGTYLVDEKKQLVIHHITGNIRPGDFGTVVRRYEFLSDNSLALSPVESTVRLTWERIE